MQKQEMFCCLEIIIPLLKFKDFLPILNAIILEWYSKMKDMAYAFFRPIRAPVFL